MQRFIALVVAGPLSLAGCAPRAEPKTLARPSADLFESIAYRTLTRDDFRGPVAERSLTEAAHATSPKCTSISVMPREVTTRAEATPGGTQYVATIDNPIFFSIFDRSCSWPSPDQSRADADVLEHEQIHFAIGEIEARRLNARVESIVQRIRSAGTDREGVSRRAALELQAVLKETEEVCVGRDILFDDQVRGGDRVRQRQWFHKLSAELNATEMFARGPQTMLPVAVASVPPPLPAPATVPPPPGTARKALTPTSAPPAAPQPLAAPARPPLSPAAPAPAATPAPVPPSSPPPVPQPPAPSAPTPSPPSTPSSSGSFPD